MALLVKEKVTVSIDPRLIAAVNREVRTHHAPSRSAVVEEALRLWQREQRRHAIESGVAEYYQSRSPKEKQDDKAWGRFSSRHAKSLWNE